MATALPWADPLDCARTLFARTREREAFAFLHSGLRTRYSGRYSLLASDPARIVRGKAWEALAPLLGRDDKTHENFWVGIFGYETGRDGESPETPFGICPAPVFFARYTSLLIFDHEEKTLTCYGEPPDLSAPIAPSAHRPPPLARLASNMPKQEYFRIVRETVEAIRAGAFYQANITRKFGGNFAHPPDPFALFDRLVARNPAPYSAFLKCGETYILSSSPERFLCFDKQGNVSTRPIKGSAMRSHKKNTDDKERQALALSAKDRAENLMIVDLMRNDLSQSCEPGSVHVAELCHVESFATLHHLSSEIAGRLKPGATAIDTVAQCFPPGSMTGAPKRAVMQWCGNRENAARGIYSGALGWFGGDGSADLSVVIRTILLESDRFEFQTGGGIVADSDPEMEWRETLLKARALADTCGIDMRMLRRL